MTSHRIIQMSTSAPMNAAPLVLNAQPAAKELPIPSATTLVQAAKYAQEQDKPIQLDYYVDTFLKRAFMGEDEQTKEKLLVKSADEYTSLIKKIYKSDGDYLVMTENSLYIVSGKIEKKRIQASSMLNNE